MKEITINTDASFNKSIAAWAFWIDTPDGVMKGAGLFPHPVDTPSMAELLSFQKAFQALTDYYPDEYFRITFFCDNIWTVRAMRGDFRMYDVTKKLHVAEAKSIWRDLRGHEIETFHVKAHQNVLTTPEQRANNWCDFHSRELVRKEIRKLNAKAG